MWLVIGLVAALLFTGVACLGAESHDEQATPMAPRSDLINQVESATPPAASTVDQQAHLLLPDLSTLPSEDLYVEYLADGTRLLRFETSVLNLGRGPLELIGGLSDDGVATATQLIQQTNGGVKIHDVGTLSVSNTHGHWHLDNFAIFELWPADPNGDMAGPTATQNKITFCLLDEVLIDPEPEYVAEVPRFITCDWQHQGISEGWMETYLASLPEQWVDITGLEDGRYALRMTLDPDNLLMESNPDNNAALTLIELRGDEVIILDRLIESAGP